MLRLTGTRAIICLLSSVISVLAARGALAEPNLVGKITEVIDGDTLTIVDPELVRHRIRLSGIDAPEYGQPFGTESHHHLVDAALGRLAHGECYKLDPYERRICRVHVDGRDVSLAQLEAGLAWWYWRYANEQPPQDRLAYEMAQNKAAADGIGLWQDKNPVPPWDWRKTERER